VGKPKLSRHLPLKSRRFFRPVLLMIEMWQPAPGKVKGIVRFSEPLDQKNPRLYRWHQLLAARRVLEQLNDQILSGGKVS